ncbi:Beta-1-4-mannosyl-glycoprotein 4-beta-N-acetylglucosaminyltransferase-like [Homarus americanus]|uniref:Beta-1-4-mannosyl-glycoprotein 4-beta-N-acetylglucosaminyltransferase-like n=1 Tax=Homarus americanus TaxID=6706 RepID=A0A8J5JI99_HOMAM|nr:Beta-1-4-mannosyl-glycoprotein 4-beta-N-acetylglucosaminyltransferase-like [Homarus americanus]
MCLRISLMRSWRRIAAECRLRKRLLLKSVVVLIVVQVCDGGRTQSVLVYMLVASNHRLQEEKEMEKEDHQGDDTVLGAWVVGQNIVLFTATYGRGTFLSQELQDPRQESGQESVYVEAQKDNTTEASPGVRVGVVSINKTGHRGGDSKSETRLPAGRRGGVNGSGEDNPHNQNVPGALTPARKDHGDGENQAGETVGKERAMKDKVEGERSIGEVEEEKEDPIGGRGVEEEFVKYRGEDKMALLVEENDIYRANIEKKSDDGVKKYAPETTVTVRKNMTKKKNNTSGMDDKSYTKNAVVNGEPNGVGTTGDGEDSVGVVQTSDFKFRTYNKSNPSEFVLSFDTRKYFQDIGENRTCFIGGTDIERTEQSPEGGCRCLDRYFGMDCGIPEAAWYGRYKHHFPGTLLRRREVPRRIINGFPVNHEFALFETRMHELYDVVDVFIVGESNYTAHGDPKDLKFLSRFQQGYLKEYQEKIVYVSLEFFSLMSQKSGWVADSYLRVYLGEKGLSLLKGVRDDDLFVLSDADELPTREILTFLKVYDGYPEPVTFALRWNVFGFFWRVSKENTWLNVINGNKEEVTHVSSVATIGMLRKVLLGNVYNIRKQGMWKNLKMAHSVRSYRDEGHIVGDWEAGTVGHYAGWHCSWCFSPENIVQKLNSAQADDKPRWGDYPEKKNLTYVATRIWRGLYVFPVYCYTIHFHLT